MNNKPSQNSKIAMVRDASSAPDNAILTCISGQHFRLDGKYPNCNCKDVGKERCTKCNAPFENHHHKHITREGIFHTSCYGKQVEIEDDKMEKQRLQEKLDWSIKVHELLDEYGYGKGSKERSKLLALTARLYCFFIR